MLNGIGDTLKMDLAALMILFSMPMIFAMRIMEPRSQKLMKCVQTISYLPRFASTGVLISMISAIST